MSRHYLNHRYSDDLALFVNSHPEYRGIVDVIENSLKVNEISYQALTRSPDFVRLELKGKGNTRLKLDLVNDLVTHIGDYESSSQLGRVDNLFNILSNKISAIPRLEIKDFADIVCIAHQYNFNWEAVINDAYLKDEWVNPLDLARYFAELDVKRFEQILWIRPVSASRIKMSCELIVDEIVRGLDNSLKGVALV